jgi:hypothetical protein
VNTVNTAGESTSRMTRYTTVRSIQACGTVASLSGVSAFSRCTILTGRVITLEVNLDNEICAS